MKRQRGVSLTEMLVCLVIIGILVALLSPALIGIKSQAKNVVDISNLRQLYAAMKLYEADNEGYPLRGNLDPFYSTYLGGTKLVCNSGVRNPSDYALYGVHDIFLSLGMKQKFDYYEQCRTLRKGEFPLVQDGNHLSTKLQYQGYGNYVLLVRESGKLDKLSYEQSDLKLIQSPPQSWPCPHDSTDLLDINY
ncbi:MAG: hypothetical protein CBB60_005545 [Armatimonadetes bacterium Cent15-Ar3]|nr:MAG: hypothetical protein CBB60_005545 [Armatimonadetes bacterium Cent15-Ar3]